MPNATLRVLVVDEHTVVRQGVRALLERGLDGAEVTDAASLQTALDGIGTKQPDVTIVDPWRAGGDVESVLATLTSKFGSPIVVFTADGGARLLSDALKAGVKGYVRKDSPGEDLVRAIQAARDGELYVDPALSSTIVLDDGMQTEAVAIKLGLSTETVRTHTKRILAKLGADTRTQAVAIGIRTGLIE